VEAHRDGAQDRRRIVSLHTGESPEEASNRRSTNCGVTLVRGCRIAQSIDSIGRSLFRINREGAAMDDVKSGKSNDPIRRAADQEALSNAPGAHPVGTGVGALSGAAAGAAIGMAAGPVGAAVGGVLGAAAGGLAGKGIAEIVNPADEEQHWRDAYVREPYFKPGQKYDQ
jgi:phage tail tape-measure protein